MKAFYMRVNDDNQVMMMDLKKKFKKKYESLLLCASTVTNNQVMMMTCSFLFLFQTVAAMDVLFPRAGEMVGGSQREERLDVLLQRMEQLKMSTNSLEWYLDLRRFGGVPHAGFGVGFDRLVQFMCGIENIRDVVPFPRAAGQAAF
jgi:hypothetical protein